VVFIVNDPAAPTIACFGYVKKFFGLRLLSLEGECLKSNNVSRRIIQSFFEDITTLGYHFIEVNSIAIYDPEYEIGVRRAGYLKPVGSFSMHLSKVTDLRKEIGYSEQWTRNLRKSRRNNLRFEVCENISQQDIHRFLDLYSKLQTDKKFHHHILPAQLEYLFTDPRFKMAMVKNDDDSLHALFIYFTDGINATSLFTAKSEEAKNSRAMFVIFSQLLQHLKQTGNHYFDANRLVPSSTKELNGVFDFKDGLEGDYVIYNNEWSWYKKSSYRILIYFVKKFLMKKREA
jgi:hypothetical protein